jgi:hypothetical protein
VAGPQTACAPQQAPLMQVVPDGQHVRTPVELTQAAVAQQVVPTTLAFGQHWLPMGVVPAGHEHLPVAVLQLVPVGQHVRGWPVVPPPQTLAFGQHAPLMHRLPSGQQVVPVELLQIRSAGHAWHLPSTQTCPRGQHRRRTSSSSSSSSSSPEVVTQALGQHLPLIH